MEGAIINSRKSGPQHHYMCIYLLLQFFFFFSPLSAFWPDSSFFLNIFFCQKKRDGWCPDTFWTRPDQTRRVLCVWPIVFHYKPNMLQHYSTQSVYGQHQDVSEHRIARHIFDKAKRAVVEGNNLKNNLKNNISCNC